MKFILATAAAALFATAAFAADPAPMPTPPATNVTTPASATPPSCADQIASARAMTQPTDATKAKLVTDELKAAEDAGDDASCRSHVTNATNALNGQ